MAALWNGTGPSLLLVCNPTIQFVVYEALKRRFIRILKSDKLGGLTVFLIGAIAKAVATILTYPVQVIQSRMRVRLNITTLLCLYYYYYYHVINFVLWLLIKSINFAAFFVLDFEC